VIVTGSHGMDNVHEKTANRKLNDTVEFP